MFHSFWPVMQRHELLAVAVFICYVAFARLFGKTLERGLRARIIGRQSPRLKTLTTLISLERAYVLSKGAPNQRSSRHVGNHRG